MNLRVVVGFADALAAVESAWSLSDSGFEVYAFARRGTRPALSYSTKVHVFDIASPEEDVGKSAEDLARAISELSPSAVMPLDDHALWLCDYVFASGRDAIIAGPTGQLARLALDKREQLRLAAGAGFAVCSSVDPLVAQPPGRGPWFVKPALAVGRTGNRLRRLAGRVAATAEEVRFIAATLDGPAIAQPLLSGTGEGVFGLATDQGVTAWTAHQRIRMMNPRGSGSSACRSIPVATDLIQPVSKMIAEAGWKGIFMVEILRDAEGQAWFMELNGRAWGSMALACRRGFAYPSWAVRVALDGSFQPPEPPSAEHVTARHLGREIVHLGAVMRHGGAPRMATLCNVLLPHRCDRWYNWRRDEIPVFLADSWATLRTQLGARRH
jgi:hypothetical protein